MPTAQDLIKIKEDNRRLQEAIKRKEREEQQLLQMIKAEQERRKKEEEAKRRKRTEESITLHKDMGFSLCAGSNPIGNL